MKKQLRKLAEEINDRLNMEMIQGDAFKKYRAYDPEVLKGSAMVNDWIMLFGVAIDKIEELENKVISLEEEIKGLSKDTK